MKENEELILERTLGPPFKLQRAPVEGEKPLQLEGGEKESDTISNIG